jgi:uncharacterized protein involved in exopolysaccharide biosynthesis
MRRILKMLARLYPAAWRERYGVEYEALIEDAKPRARDGFDVFWGAMTMRVTSRSFVRIVLPCALAGGLMAVGISFSRPVLYRSRTLVTVDTHDLQSLDKELMGRTQQLLAQPILASLIERENLYPSERARMPLGAVVDLMRKNISILSLQKNGGQPAPGFVFQFAYPDPRVAQRVDQELVSQMVGENLRAAIANRSADSPRTTFIVRKPADLPMKPFLPNRGEFGVGGLLAGFVAGLISAALLGSRQHAASVDN